MDAQNAIEVKNVSKSFKVYLDKGRTLKELALFSSRRKYENRQVLKNISFNVKKGEAVALVGHNGCGKSTTLKLLTKIMYPDQGTIEMQGRVSSLIELGAGFHPDMSGRKNIYINASIFGLTKKEIDARVDDIIEFSELREFIDNPVRTYSSGMYMRLAFAVAINVNADILLIDEILAVGDANFQAKCFERMQELKASGITIVLVTHDGNTVKSFCNRAIWINEGEIASEGNAAEVVDRYMAHMDAKRIEEINAAAASAQPSVEIEEEDVDSLSMDPDAIHFGNQKAQIVKCTLINSEGNAVNALRSDEKYYLRFEYKVNKQIDELVFGMGIFTLDGVWVFGTNSAIAGETIRVTGKRGTVIFESEPLNLMSGKYILQCSIIEPNTTPVDYYNEYMRFNVVNIHHEAGIIHYDSKWHIGEEQS